MRILVVADLHYSLKQFDWLCSHAGKYDLLVIAGDLLDLAGNADLDAQMVVVEKYLGRFAATTIVAVCSGNHDLDVETEHGERRAEWLEFANVKGVFVDNQGFTIEDCRFTVCPWWDGPESQREVAELLQRESLSRGKRWIWMYHAPPGTSKTSWTKKGDAGDAFLTAQIAQYQPDIVFGGHIHNSPFIKGGSWIDRVDKTWVFNPGRQMVPDPAFIVLDLDAMEATWDCGEEKQTIRLAETA
jgi:Icc-related predicted phosphoesterase